MISSRLAWKLPSNLQMGMIVWQPYKDWFPDPMQAAVSSCQELT